MWGCRCAVCQRSNLIILQIHSLSFKSRFIWIGKVILFFFKTPDRALSWCTSKGEFTRNVFSFYVSLQSNREHLLIACYFALCLEFIQTFTVSLPQQFEFRKAFLKLGPVRVHRVHTWCTYVLLWWLSRLCSKHFCISSAHRGCRSLWRLLFE